MAEVGVKLCRIIGGFGERKRASLMGGGTENEMGES